MTSHRALIVVVPALAFAACTANISTPAQPSPSPSTVTVTPSASAAPTTAVTVTPPSETTTVTIIQKPPAPTATCGPSSAQAAFDANKAKLPPAAGPNNPWVMSQAGNGYEQCGQLSWIIFTTGGGTAGSAAGIMLFYRGQYLGTATKETYGYDPDVLTKSPTSIVVTYRYLQGNDPMANPSGRAVATFTWDPAQQKVVQTGELPPKQR